MVQAIAAGQLVISVATRKKELVGDFKAIGRELHPKGSPIPIRAHDFIDKQLGKAISYGVYDTAQFSVASIQAWWQQLGRER